ncbi:transcription termination/antitermination NusG family protein [Chitinophaga rhizophila]|uniref:NusG-like N-terminal domain-containing protein n=1 Tax=Chitinophaga rhizophila TaxID=2866212 RepID=A0ABS7GIT5_9BACT|nr:hypothetical protein [Chitinophaga rhizophila]
MSHFVSAWYLLYTRPCYEKKIAERLDDLETTYLLPLRKVLTNYKIEKHMHYEPVFSSYIFVHLNSIQQYFDCPGVNGVLCFVKFE